MSMYVYQLGNTVESVVECLNILNQLREISRRCSLSSVEESILEDISPSRVLSCEMTRYDIKTRGDSCGGALTSMYNESINISYTTCKHKYNPPPPSPSYFLDVNVVRSLP